MDTRLKWIRERILSYLGFENIELFNNMLDANDGELYEKINSFVNDPIMGTEKNIEKMVFHVHRTYYDKLVEVEKEITEWRIVPPIVKLTSPPHSSKKKGKDKDKGKPKPKPKKETEPETIVDDIGGTKSPDKIVIDHPTDDNFVNQDENIPKRTNLNVDFADDVKADDKEDYILPSTKPPILDPDVDGSIEYYTLKRFVPMMMRLPKFNGGFGSIKIDDINMKANFVYIIRLTESSIPIPVSDSMANSSLPEHFSVGSCHSNIMPSMLEVLKQSYSEFLESNLTEEKSISEHSEDSRYDNDQFKHKFYSVSHNYQISKIACKNIVATRMITDQSNADKPKENSNIDQKDSTDNVIETSPVTSTINTTWKILIELINSAEWSNEYIECEIQFPMPNITSVCDESISIYTIVKDKDIIGALEKTVKNWKTHIVNKIDVSSIKNLVAEDPLQEYEFWKKKYFDILKLKEQLRTPMVKRIINILIKAESKSVKILEELETNIIKYYKQSKNNLNLLSTLLRYFKIITECSDFNIINSSIPGLMNGLNMLWILSIFFCRDEQMVPLLECIANCLCTKIELSLAPKTLFLKPLDEIAKLARDGKKMLENWRVCYMKTRKNIEESGKNARWEFDERRLFHRTNYLATVCEDLSKVVQILIEFENILGDEFKSIITNPLQIDKLIECVHQLVYPIQSIDFSVFIPDNKENWDVIMNDFYREVMLLEENVKKFIDVSFGSLRSSEDAMEVLIKFINAGTRNSIQSQLITKFDFVLEQFSNEILLIKNILMKHQIDPYLLRNHPPISGKILWARLLYDKLSQKNSIFLMNKFLDNYMEKSTAFQYYSSLGVLIKKYEDTSYNDWLKSILPILSNTMSSKLLKLTTGSGEPLKARQLKKFSIKDSNTVLISKKKRSITSINASGKYILNDNNLLFDVNFISKYFEIIEEIELMEYLGFKLPMRVRQYAMLRNTVHKDLQIFKSIIVEYIELTKSLTIFEAELMRIHLHEMEKCLNPGLERIIWSSLGTKQYISKCRKALDALFLLYKQITMLNNELSMKIDEMEQFNLFSIVYPENITNSSVCYPCDKFFSKMKIARFVEVDSMNHIYQTIGPILIKLENLVLGTSTGESLNMINVYQHWEMKIFNAFIRCCINNMQKFNETLISNSCVFEVDAILLAVEINLSPSLKETNNIIVQNVEDFISRMSTFSRWTRGTCKICPPQTVNDSDDFLEYTYFDDIKNVQAIKKWKKILYDTTNKITLKAQVYMQKWLKYKALWIYDKLSTCEKFTVNCTEIVKFDDKFLFFENIINELNEHDRFVDIGSIRINIHPIISQIKNHAFDWKKTLGKSLIKNTKEKMKDFNDLIIKQRTNLNINIKGLNDFKLVMLTINQIKKITITAEVLYKSLQEIFNILQSHNIDLDESDVKLAHLLETQWHSLYTSSLFQSEKLIKIKDKFAEITLREVEEFLIKIKLFTEKFNSEGPGAVENNLDKGLKLMKDYAKMFTSIDARRYALCRDEQLFENPLADYSEFLQSKLDYEGLESIYAIYQEQRDKREEWSSVLWVDLNPQELNDGIEMFLKKFRELPKYIKEKQCGVTLHKEMKEFKSTIPLMLSMKNEAINERHWKELMTKTGQTFDIALDKFTLGNMFALNLHSHPEILENIINCAIKELNTERDIKDIENIWENLKFSIKPYKKNDEERGFILNSCDDIINLLDEHSMKLQRLSTSQFIGPFLPTVLNWEKKLSSIGEVVEEWLITQQKWLYLEGIFVGTDIRTQLPSEAKKFDEIELKFKMIMDDTAKEQLVVACCLSSGRYEEFKMLLEGLYKCQKSLNEFLDVKRNKFPRFFFISTDELLSLIGSKDPLSVQIHIIKMFDNIKALNITNDNNTQSIASAMISCENEIIEFHTNVTLGGYIENWMNCVVDEMKASNKVYTKEAIYYYGTQHYGSRNEWIQKNLGMICLTVNIVWWTAETEEAFIKLKKGNKTAMKQLLYDLNQQLANTVRKVREELTPNEFKKFKTIITVDVHARDIIEGFVMNNITSNQQFEWEKQLRFYWIKQKDDLQIQQCTGLFDYGYEYMGLNGRLVITPLTDRIYLTLTQALTMHLGGAPAGPAGTGKTETVKDLAKTIARLCIVTNCGEGMDFLTIGQIFSGLCPCGAWGCFDEFNRIDISILSVISSQIQSIRNALLMKHSTLILGNKEINIDKNVGIFITMNPGYAGRTELPESIKALFRPVVCIVPDFEMICQISLYSDGFFEAQILAKKVTVLYNIARQQLSKQSHYDWGLRAVMSLLRMAGYFKRSCPDLAENITFMKALRDINLPKLVTEDIPLFMGLIKDLFPGLEIPKAKYSDLNNAIDLNLIENGYSIIPSQIEKIIQLYETMMTRHSTMIVGPTGGGKSVIIQTLVDSQKRIGIPTKLITLNPKACSVIELYGILDPVTRDWTDGLFSLIFRKMNNAVEKNGQRYILFDGDIDPLWIENMNSVMDDNKLLTLANGERIRLAAHCSLLFEVGNLNYASPATISRAGMIYVDSKCMSYNYYWNRWISNIKNTALNEQFDDLFKLYVPDALNYIFFGVSGAQQFDPLKLIFIRSPLNMIIQLCIIIDGLFLKKSSADYYDDDVIHCGFIIALYYSLGAPLLEESRLAFDEFIKKKCTIMMIDDEINKKASTKNLPRKYPTLFDYHLNLNDRCWEAWEWLIPTYIHDRSISFYKILVPTIDTLRVMWLMDLMKRINKPFLLTGDVGSSKTSIITHFLNKQNYEEFMVSALNFSSRTTSMDVQRIIEAQLEKHTKINYGPSLGKKLLIFIDDMNMPQVDNYGTQQPIALLKLLLEKNGMYDRGGNLNWKQLCDINYIAAMGKSGGGRNDVDPRFLSKFSIYNLSFPSKKTLNHIYLSILKGHLEIFPMSIQEIAPTVIELTLDIFHIILKELAPTPTKFHYIFNLQDLTRILTGLGLTEPSLYPEPKYLVRVWRNEFSRVICDRLINSEDQNMLQDHIANTVGKYFGEESEKEYKEKPVNEIETNQVTPAPITPILTSDSDVITDIGLGEISDDGIDEEEFEIDKIKELSLEEYVLRDPLLYGDFRNALNEDTRYYEDLLDYDAVYYLFQEILEEYNESIGKIPLILFEECIEHLTRVHRVLRMERNHMLLVGVSCSGKQSIVKLASYAAGKDIYQIIPSRGYDENAFKEDLKHLYNLLGVENKKIVFLLRADQITDEGFLEIINNMLVSGMVPNLFTDEDKDEIIKAIQDNFIGSDITKSKDSIWKHFCNVCTINLHIVLTTGPGDLLRNRCRNFPGLINNTTINWVFPWPNQALLAVANIFLAEVAHIPEQYRDSIVQHIIYVDSTVKKYTNEYMQQLRRCNYVTPQHFINFITYYVSLLDSKISSINMQCTRLDDGLVKIEEANIELFKLNSQLSNQKEILSEQMEKCDLLVTEITNAKSIANEKKSSASSKSSDIEEKFKLLSEEKKVAEEILSAALPALDNARLALKDLEKSDITEIRSFATPPEPVQIICECVLIVRGHKDINWKSARGMMSDPNFLQHLLTMDCDLITENQIKAVNNHLKLSQKWNTMETISKAGNGLYKFVLAVLGYCNVFKDVKPKIERVEQLENEHKNAILNLEQLNSEINKVDEQLFALNDKYETALKSQQELQATNDVMKRRLTAADKLLSGLSSESTRWKEELKHLQSEKPKLMGNCLLLAGFLSYLGPFTIEFRNQMVYQDWFYNIQQKNIPISLPFQIEPNIISAVEINKWNSEGLPPDEFSIQNGILLTHSRSFPICIDPQSQAIDWIKKKEEKNGLKIITFNDVDYLKQLELAIKYGSPLLIQDITNNINPIVEEILSKNIIIKNSCQYIMLGNLEVDYDPNFRLYLTTKLLNPNFNTSTYSKAVIINFLITLTSLEDQLLRIVINNESPKLETEYEDLIKKTSDNKIYLHNLEDSLLLELATSTGNMLDNESLISTLENTKLKAAEISEELRITKETSDNINVLRDAYRPIAIRGAILYFILLDMATIHMMYQYSFYSYTNIFIRSLKESLFSNELDERLTNMIEKLTWNIYEYGCTSIFECHKTLFSFQITISLEKYRKNISQRHINFFIKGSMSLEKTDRECTIPWIPTESWENLCRLSIDFPNEFSEIIDDISNKSDIWNEWYNNDYPESINIPWDNFNKLNGFEVLMLLRCLRIDRIYSAINQYITKIMGEKFVCPPISSLENIFEQTSSGIIVIFILSAGSDPTNNLIELAETHGHANKFKYLSLGQGQESIALGLLDAAIINGEWLMLQNCHLLIHFLHTLEKRFDESDIHPDFRLWLTTEPSPEFPIGILQNAIKVVTEPPSSLKLNLRNTYYKIQDAFLEDCIHPCFKKIIYVLGFFHAVILERRKYGKIGWNISYNFNDSDYTVCLQILSHYLEKCRQLNDAIPWATIKYLFGEVIYGGRVIDDYDRRIINTYLDEYLGDFLFYEFQSYHFYENDVINYSIPQDSTKLGYIEFIDSLPLMNSPEVLGLHTNAEIGYNIQFIQSIWNNLLEMHPERDIATVNETREDIINSIADNILAKIPETFNIMKIKKQFEISISPTFIVLLQELERFNLLTSKMFTTLQLIKKTLAGEIGLDSILEDVSDSLYSGRLPKVWRNLTPETCKGLGNWIDYFCKRVEQYTLWATKEEPLVMWLSGLHVPEAYMVAHIQIACRHFTWPLDQCTQFTHVTSYTNLDEVEERPKNGCYIHGLYLEGARWDIDQKCLKKSHPKILTTELPIISILPTESNKLNMRNILKTPVYTTSLRRNAMGLGFVFESQLSTVEHDSLWILQGVCVLMNTD